MSISEIPIEYGMRNRCVNIRCTRTGFSVLEIAYKKPSSRVADFGMCYLEDLVNEVKDNKELVVGSR